MDLLHASETHVIPTFVRGNFASKREARAKGNIPVRSVGSDCTFGGKSARFLAGALLEEGTGSPYPVDRSGSSAVSNCREVPVVTNLNHLF
jgi:hypothetical protein